MAEGMTNRKRTSLESWAEGLLAATETIHAGFLADAPPAELAVARSERDACFAGLKAAIEAGAAPDRAVRAAVAHVRALDAEILSIGGRLIEAVRTERHALERRRAALQVHARRERPMARAITLKA